MAVDFPVEMAVMAGGSMLQKKVDDKMAAVCPATDAGPHFLQSIGSTDLKCKAFLLVKEEKKKIFRPFVIRRIHPEWKLSSERKGRGGKNYKKLFLLNKPNG